MQAMTPTPEQVEASRARLNIPADWIWGMCAAECGELVWHSGAEQAAVEAKGTPFALVCSATCALALTERLS